MDVPGLCKYLRPRNQQDKVDDMKELTNQTMHAFNLFLFIGVVVFDLFHAVHHFIK